MGYLMFKHVMCRYHSYVTQSSYRHKLANVATMDFTEIRSSIGNILYQFFLFILKEDRIGVVRICPIDYIPLFYTILELTNFLKGHYFTKEHFFACETCGTVMIFLMVV